MTKAKILRPAKLGTLSRKQIRDAVKKVSSLRKEKTYPKAAELQDRLHAVIKEYDGEIGFAEAIGVLELLKAHMREVQLSNLRDD